MFMLLIRIKFRSEGTRPHHINIHFPHLVSIHSIRLYLDFEADGSFTPTRIFCLAGTGYHDLIPFSELDMRRPKGWVDVPLENVGGDDGKTLRVFLVQIQIADIHQNGKDARVRGLKVYTQDEGISQVKQGGMKGEAGKQYSVYGQPNGDKGHLLGLDWLGGDELR